MPFGIDDDGLAPCTLRYTGDPNMPTLDSVLEPLERIEVVVPPSSEAWEIFRQVAGLYKGRKVELTEGGHIIVMAPKEA